MSRETFYSKKGLSSDGDTVKPLFRYYKLPHTYSAIVYSLMNSGEHVPDKAYRFKYNDNVVIIDDEFELIDYGE